jgi:HAD superfamily hydrolase (TIGR01662 family)
MTLYIFDKDGTVLRRAHNWLRLPIPPTRCEDQILLPGVYEKMAALRAAGHQLALASNQEAVARGQLKLPQAQDLMINCAAKLGGVDAWRMSPYDPRAPKRLHGHANAYARDDPSRKPHPGMITDLMTKFAVAPNDTVMVGNSRRDQAAARAAGVRYVPAKKFFQEAHDNAVARLGRPARGL